MPPHVSIILLTKNAGDRFEEVMKGIESQSYDGDLSTVVVDSGSTDGTLDIARRYGCDVHEIDPDEFHHSRTRNDGAQRASGEVLVYLTHDAVPRDDRWVAELVAPLAEDGVQAAYGRQIAYPDAKPMDEFFYSHFYPTDPRRLDHTDATDPRQFYLDNVFISDVTSAVDAETWDRLRFQDDVPMSEDKDFALRLLREGGEIAYQPSAAVYHSHDYSLVDQFRRRYKDGTAFSQIATEGSDEYLSDGLDYFFKEMRFLVRNDHLKWIPYAVTYDFLHFMGFNLGKYAAPRS